MPPETAAAGAPRDNAHIDNVPLRAVRSASTVRGRQQQQHQQKLQKKKKKQRQGLRSESDDAEFHLDSNLALLRRHTAHQSIDSDSDSEIGTHDATHGDWGSPSVRSRILAFMSKAPLLLRSAPGFGTGSYGAAPIGAHGADESEDEEVRHTRRSLRRKRSRLARSGSGGFETLVRRSTNESGDDLRRSIDGSGDIRFRKSSSRLRRTSRSLSRTSGEQIREEIGIAGRYGAGGLPIQNDTVFEDLDEEDEAVDLAETPLDLVDDDASGEEDDDEDPPDNSRYAQVRASVSAKDDISLSINTPRMWFLSLIFAIFGSSSNLLFSLRYPSIAITPVIALLLVHPLGLTWDMIFKRKEDPEEVFENGSLVSSNKPSLRQWLAQGRWNEKEHCLTYVSSTVSFGFAFATDVIIEQAKFYKQDVTITYQLLLILSTQILGYTFAGLTRKFLVAAPGMIWPGTLMSCAMFTTLHKEENHVADGWRITRWRFFFITWFAAFAWYFVPGLLFPALSYFSVVTWFVPKNVVVANLFGVASGLGLFPLTFDWAQIAYIGSPLLTPFWAAMNVVGGLVLVMWILAPIMYYMNFFESSYMPILSSAVFDNTGKVYDVSKILTPDFLFDKDAYHAYSRVYLPITYVLSYGLQFAALTSLLTHTALWHGKDIWKQSRRSLHEVDEPKAYKVVRTDSHGSRDARHQFGATPASAADTSSSQEDVHNRLMKRYEDAPIWWYLATCISMTAVGMFLVEYYPVHLPWYGLLLSLAICAILFIPIGIVMAITNCQSSIYLICQLVCGVVFPGRPVANMIFVTYGYISSAQGIKFSSDLKLGHYMKIPPRILFTVQMAATIVSSLTQIGVLNWAFAYIPGICTPEALNGFSCPIARVHFNGSILWGVVGPAQFFGRGALYRPLIWCFAFGAVAPIPLYCYARSGGGSGSSRSNSKNPTDSTIPTSTSTSRNLARKIHLPLLFGSLAWIPPATGLNFSVWALVCYLFNHLIRHRHEAWWNKYTMTLSAALDSGLAFGLVVVFFGFVLPGRVEGFRWWGTEVYKQGCDWLACSFRNAPDGGHFGPDEWVLG